MDCYAYKYETILNLVLSTKMMSMSKPDLATNDYNIIQDLYSVAPIITISVIYYWLVFQLFSGEKILVIFEGVVME